MRSRDLAADVQLDPLLVQTQVERLEIDYFVSHHLRYLGITHSQSRRHMLGECRSFELLHLHWE